MRGPFYGARLFYFNRVMNREVKSDYSSLVDSHGTVRTDAIIKALSVATTFVVAIGSTT